MRKINWTFNKVLCLLWGIAGLTCWIMFAISDNYFFAVATVIGIVGFYGEYISDLIKERLAYNRE